MSLTGDRAAIAAALTTVTGVKGYQYRPATPRPGDAWPRLVQLDLLDGLVWSAEWTVIVFLPQDERAASVWIDDHFLAIVAALRVPGFATKAEAAQLQTDGGDQFVLAVTMRSE